MAHTMHIGKKILVAILTILLSACGGGGTPTPSPYQPYLDAINEITKESQPYANELVALGKRNAQPSEYRPLLSRWAVTAAKYTVLNAPAKFQSSQDYLNEYAREIATALKDLDANDMLAFTLDMGSAEESFHIFVQQRDIDLAKPDGK